MGTETTKPAWSIECEDGAFTVTVNGERSGPLRPDGVYSALELRMQEQPGKKGAHALGRLMASFSKELALIVRDCN